MSKRITFTDTQICVIEQLFSAATQYQCDGDSDRLIRWVNDFKRQDLVEVFNTVFPLATKIGDEAFKRLVDHE